jgi:hypothetical protein
MEAMQPMQWMAVMVILSAALSGCAPHSFPVGESQLTAEQQAMDDAWLAAERTLWAYGFEIANQDRREGTMTTKPMTAQYGLEFWRRDAADAYGWLEGTIQTLQRTAEVQVIGDAGDPMGYDYEITVRTLRMNRDAFSITSVYELYNRPAVDVRSHFIEAADPGIDAVKYLPDSSGVSLGDYPALEKKMRRDMRNRLARLRQKRPGQSPPAGGD